MDKKLKDKLTNLGLMALVGGVAGIIGSQVLLPWLAGFSIFAKIDWVRQAGEGTMIINRTERVVITENEALEQAMAKAGDIVVAVISEKTEKISGNRRIPLAKPEILAQGSGFIASSDGLVVTSANLITDSTQKIMIVMENKQIEAQLEKKDKSSGLALLKISENNLPVLPFFEGELRLGERLFLVGAKFIVQADSQGQFSKFVDLSLVQQILPALVTDFSSKEINGSPIFNIKSEIVGVNLVGAGGQNKIAAVSEIRDLMK